MSSLQNWVKKMQQLFSSQEQEKSETLEKLDKGKTKEKRSYGYLERNEEYSSQARMTYQYAKPGKFRFPLIEDNRDRHQAVTPSISSQIQKESSEEKESEKKKKPFSNSQFKPTVIPSAIHGYGSQEQKNNQQEQTKSFSPFHIEDIKEERKEAVTSPIIETEPKEKLEAKLQQSPTIVEESKETVAPEVYGEPIKEESKETVAPEVYVEPIKEESKETVAPEVYVESIKEESKETVAPEVYVESIKEESKETVAPEVYVESIKEESKETVAPEVYVESIKEESKETVAPEVYVESIKEESKETVAPEVYVESIKEESKETVAPEVYVESIKEESKETVAPEVYVESIKEESKETVAPEVYVESIKEESKETVAPEVYVESIKEESKETVAPEVYVESIKEESKETVAPEVYVESIKEESKETVAPEVYVESIKEESKETVAPEVYVESIKEESKETVAPEVYVESIKEESKETVAPEVYGEPIKEESKETVAPEVYVEPIKEESKETVAPEVYVEPIKEESEETVAPEVYVDSLKEESDEEQQIEQLTDQETLDLEELPNEELEVEREVSEKAEKIVERPKQGNQIKDGPKQGTQSELQKRVPFNVLMLPKDKQKSLAKEQPIVDKRPMSEKTSSSYVYPSIQLLNYPNVQTDDDTEWLNEQSVLLEETLQSFNVDATVVHVTKGPSVTRFEIQPARGVKVNKITNLTDDIKLSLAAKDIRIEAPIPGKNTIGIEVPNRASVPVFLREILRRDVFLKPDSPLNVALGLDISGHPIVTDLKKMPHGLVAGATGSGKSVCINSVLISLLYKANPDEVKLLLIDPKMVELAPYNELPHLITPVITDAKQATAALKWVVAEMERRYELFSKQGVRDVGRYNDLYSESPDKPALPYVLVVIDELADLMMVSPQDVEDAICRIAQKARACGIHLLLATQRPSVDVITGLIKANIPTRIAFSVSSQTDSRTILDMSGAERLLGKGDMLFHENGTPKPIRVQGTFVSDEEIEDVIAHVKKQRGPDYLLEIDQLQKVQEFSEQEDELFEEACHYVIEQGSASASSLQRRFRVGYNRAARLIDMMEERGVVSEAMGSKARHVLVDEIELEESLYHKESE
ncbi:DNA translocase FtsK [Bacillus solitudinis]|uniref:DNA translocase FtsK n=1 Tax=Bacillus solitudinis TaxID=2014074 RepID=UPI001D0D3E35|nr:DNA translocase FtsK [Bacillus solitudinis]